LGQVLSRHPKIEVKLIHAISGKILESLRNDQLDAGFYLGDVTDPDIHVVQLSTLRYLVVAPKIWEAQIKHANWQDIAALPWIGTPEHSSQHRLVRQMFDEHDCHQTSVIEADQESSMQSLVCMGVGLCLLREDVAIEAENKGFLSICTVPNGTVRSH